MSENLKKLMRRELRDLIGREREAPILSGETAEKAKRQLEALK